MLAKYVMKLSGCSYIRRQEFKLDFFNVSYWFAFIVDVGRFSYELEGESGVAEEGDLIVFPPNRPIHRVIQEPLGVFSFILQWRSRDGQLQKNEDRVIDELPSYSFRLRDRGRMTSTLKQLRLLRSTGQLSRLNLEVLEHLVNDLYIYALLEQSMEHKTELETTDLLMERVRSQIEAQASRKLSLSELAASSHLSASQFTRRFHAAFGLTPMAYVNHVRMEKARSYLQNTEYSLDHIAELCGYDNRFYFSRAFSKQMKLSPSEYRRLHQM